MVFLNPANDKYVVDYTKISQVDPVSPERRISLENVRTDIDERFRQWRDQDDFEERRPGQSGPRVPPVRVRLSLDGRWVSNREERQKNLF